MLTLTPRDWDLNKTAWFRRPSDEFGGFSNMSVSFPLTVLGMHVRSSEHLYQAMRFTHEAEIQRDVLQAKSPMESKRIAREWDAWTRSDWMDIRVNAMQWALRTKLAQHVSRFGSLLKSTGTRPIVEWSRHDSFWGAGPINQETVHGVNVLGQLLTELCDDFIAHEDEARTISAPTFPDAHILGIPMVKIVPAEGEPLLHQQDLIDLSLPPGPAFGIILQACFQRQMNGEFSTVEEGLPIAKALWKAHTRIDNSESV